jgi:hypothetical protein
MPSRAFHLLNFNFMEQHQNFKFALIVLGFISLTVGFALIKPAFGFIAFGTLCAGLAFATRR